MAHPFPQDALELPVPTLAPLMDAHASEEAKKLFQGLNAKFRMVPNIFRTMGHAPAVLGATGALNDAIHHDLPPNLRELAYLKTSLINNCHY
jgi:alkylhydroperoxidase family enzyme